MDIPLHFCWTRFGTEASQTVDQILARKERERQANGGIFLWGIGNALGPSIRELVRRDGEPEVLFSPIRSAPRLVDISPRAVVAWTAGRTIWGERYELPEASIVTSRYDPLRPRISHYALVCYREQKLGLEVSGRQISLGSLRNLVTGRKVGSSQVTAVVERKSESSVRAVRYSVSMRAFLVPPFFVRLTEPALVSVDASGAPIRLGQLDRTSGASESIQMTFQAFAGK